MTLSDFDTLALAQAYTETRDKKQVGSGQARGYLVGIGIWNALRGFQADLTHTLSALSDAVIVTASDASSFFGTDSSTAEGQGNITSIGIFVAAGILTQVQADDFLALAISTVNPFESSTQADFDLAKGVEEVLPIAGTGSQQVFTLSTTTQPPKPINVKVQQRFGANSNDLTEWHDCGSFVGVNYTQQVYKAQIAASPAAYRELRAVSETTVGMSIV